MEWIKIGTLDEFPLGTKRLITLEGKKMLLINNKGKIYAIAHLCPHMQLPLKKGKIEDETIVCPWHHSSFNLNTGEVKKWAPFPPGLGKILGALSKSKPLPIFPTKIEEDSIWVSLEPADIANTKVGV